MSANVGTTYIPDFTDAQCKLDRAKRHIADVDAAIATFLASNFYRLRMEPNYRERRIEIFLDSLHEPDRALDVIIGDAVGNLRSALDYIAVAIVQPITGSTEQTSFPIAKEQKSFEGLVKGQKGFGPCHALVIDTFIDMVQAYEGGAGHDLWVLNKLRNTDKHRLLLTSVQLAGIVASWKTRSGSTFVNCSMSVKAGDSGKFISSPADDFQFTDQPRPAFQVEFNEAGVITGQPVPIFLHSTAEKIQSLLNSLKIFTFIRP